MRARATIVVMGVAAALVLAAGCSQKTSEGGGDAAVAKKPCSEWTHPRGNAGNTLSCGDSIDGTPDAVASRVFEKELGTLVYAMPAEDKIILLFDNPAPEARSSSGIATAFAQNGEEVESSLIKAVHVEGDPPDATIEDDWEQRFSGDHGGALMVHREGTIVFAVTEQGNTTVSALHVEDGRLVYQKVLTDTVAESIQLNHDSVILDGSPPDGGTRTVSMNLENGETEFTWEDVTPAVDLTFALGDKNKTLLRASSVNFEAFSSNGEKLWEKNLSLDSSKGVDVVGDAAAFYLAGLGPLGEPLVKKVDAGTGELEWEYDLTEVGSSGPPALALEGGNVFAVGVGKDKASVVTEVADSKTGERLSVRKSGLDDGLVPQRMSFNQGTATVLNITAPPASGQGEQPKQVFRGLATSSVSGELEEVWGDPLPGPEGVDLFGDEADWTIEGFFEADGSLITLERERELREPSFLEETLSPRIWRIGIRLNWK